VICFISVVAGRVFAAFAAKDSDTQQAVTLLAAAVIFAVLFFGSRR